MCFFFVFFGEKKKKEHFWKVCHLVKGGKFMESVCVCTNEKWHRIWKFVDMQMFVEGKVKSIVFYVLIFYKIKEQIYASPFFIWWYLTFIQLPKVSVHYLKRILYSFISFTLKKKKEKLKNWKTKEGWKWSLENWKSFKLQTFL